MKLVHWLKWLVIGVLVLFLLLVLGIVPQGAIDVAANLLLGWIIYLARVIPEIHVNVAGVFSAVVCVLMLVMLGHRMARWLWRETRGESSALDRAWRARWTFSILAIIVLMFIASIGVVGATHQTAWLIRSDKPLFRIGVSANRVKCASNLRQIGQAISIYADEHEGKLPDSLASLLLVADLTPETFLCPMSDDEKALGNTPLEQADHLDESHCSYIYHGRGLRMPLPADLPIACEPLSLHEGQTMNVLFGDGHVEWLDPQQAAEALARVRVP